MATFYKQLNNSDQFLLTIYEGPKVGAHADIAAEIVRAIINESERLGEAGRFYVESLVLARNSLLLRVKLNEKQMEEPETHLREMKMIMYAICNDIYTKRRMGIKG